MSPTQYYLSQDWTEERQAAYRAALPGVVRKVARLRRHLKMNAGDEVALRRLKELER